MTKPLTGKQLALTLGAACREARLRLNLTQEDVAERINLVTEVYGRLERGNMLPSVETLRRLSVALGVPADTLLSLSTAEGVAAYVAPPLPEGSPAFRRLV